MPDTTFLQYYPDGSHTYVPQRRLSADDTAATGTARRPSLTEMMNERSKMDERRRSEAVSEKAATLGGVQSLRQGKLPTNDQLDRIMQRLMTSRSIENNKRYMSSDGQVLLQDFKELLQAFQHALKNKNRDELFQSMIYHVRRSEEAYRRDHGGITSGDGNHQNVKEELKSGAGAILKIAKLFLFNTQFRSLLEQILTIAQQTLGVSLQESGKMLNDNSKGNNKLSSKMMNMKSASTSGNKSMPESSTSGNQNPGGVSGKIDDSWDTIAQSGNLDPSHNWEKQNTGTATTDSSPQDIHNTSNTNQLASSGHQERTIFGKHQGGNFFLDQSNFDRPHAAPQHLPEEHREFLSHRFVEPEPPLHPTDDAGHTLTDDLHHGASINHQQQNGTMGNNQPSWLSNSMSPTTSPTTSQQQASSIPLSTHSPVLRDSDSKDHDNPQVRNAYLTNLSSLSPTAQVSDSNLRRSLASVVERNSDLNPEAPSFYASSLNHPMTDRGVSPIHTSQGDIGSPLASGNNDNSPMDSPLDTSLRGGSIGGPLSNTGAMKGVDSLRQDSALRADRSMMTNQGATNAPTSGQNDHSSQQNTASNNATFSASKIVNKMKQKANATDDDMMEDEDESSISTNEIVSKLKEIVTSIQKHPDYQDAISTLFSLFGVWGQRLRTGSGGMDRRRSSAVAVPEQCEYYKNVATFEAKTIIEDWAGGKSLDPILEQLYNLSSKMNQDSNLHNLFEKITHYIKRLLQEPGYAASDESTKDGDQLVDQVRGSAIEEYKPHVRSVLQQSSDIIKTISQDETSQEISGKFKDIHNHLWFDGHGNASFKPQLLNDMRITLLPALIEQIKYVPLPQIVYSDKQYEIAIENMVLEGDTLMPDIFEIKADDYLRFSPYANNNDSSNINSYNNTQSLNIHMTGIQTTMHDVIFYYKRKTGFPRMSDSGVVSLTTGGSGLRISMRITSSSWDQYHTFKVDQCHAHIDKLDIKVSSCKHNIMYKVFNPVLTGIVKRQMCKTIEKKMITLFETGDEKLTRRLRISRNQQGSSSNGRPGVFTHLINMLNQKVVSAI